MSKSKTHEEMLYYINETHKNGWSRSMVLNQIELKAYERSLEEFGHQLADRLIPWFTLVEIIYKSKSHEEMWISLWRKRL